jgi:hypothetical protein
MQLIDLPYCRLSLLECYTYLKIKEDAHIDEAEAKEIMRRAYSLNKGTPFVLLTDTSAFYTITPEARKAFADSNNSKLVIANAVLANNLPSKLIANFFSNFNKPHYKFKVFSNERKAIEWLEVYSNKLINAHSLKELQAEDQIKY